MNSKNIVRQWFENWQSGDYRHLPITENFRHTSPFGTIEGKKAYMDMVDANKEKFLGYQFEIHDELYEKDRACVRYTAIQDDFMLDVSEWYYLNNNQIETIISYYHIGEIRNDRKLKATP